MLRVMDAPGYCTAFLREGKRRRRGRPERAATPLAHALYTPLSLPPHLPEVTAGMRIDCVSPIRPLCGQIGPEVERIR